jgi:hypothetical protein
MICEGEFKFYSYFLGLFCCGGLAVRQTIFELHKKKDMEVLPRNC